MKKIAAESLYVPGGQSTMGTSWSPDSKWVAYTLITPTFFRRVHVYSLDQDKSFPVTDGLSDVDEPTFDAEGKYLWFLASTDAGPANQWFDMSNEDTRRTAALYLAVLRKDLPNPLAKESDEEKPKDEKADAAKPADKAAPAAAKAKAGEPAASGCRSGSISTGSRTGSSPLPIAGRRLQQPPGGETARSSTAKRSRRRPRPRAGTAIPPSASTT